MGFAFTECIILWVVWSTYHQIEQCAYLPTMLKVLTQNFFPKFRKFFLQDFVGSLHTKSVVSAHGVRLQDLLAILLVEESIVTTVDIQISVGFFHTHAHSFIILVGEVNEWQVL